MGVLRTTFIIGKDGRVKHVMAKVNTKSHHEDVMALINQARATARTCGNTTYPAAAPLAWSNKLFDASAGHSADMANNNYFSHTSLDGRTFSQRIVAAGYTWSRLGENIAAGYPTVNAAVDGWMASEGHCVNMMNPTFRDVGLACVASETSTFPTYWTMDAGAQR